MSDFKSDFATVRVFLISTATICRSDRLTGWFGRGFGMYPLSVWKSEPLPGKHGSEACEAAWLRLEKLGDIAAQLCSSLILPGVGCRGTFIHFTHAESRF